jgi:hypothetical protein
MKKQDELKMTNHQRLNKDDRDKAVKDWYMIYDVYGYRYKFENIYLDESGTPYGYCKKKRIWAWLYLNGISCFGKDIEFIPAVLIENNGIALKE